MTKSPFDADPVIASAVETSGQQKELADRAIAQLTDEQLHEALDPETNSVAVIMQHLAGNIRSRWTDFLTSDGEKPWRDRDDEFVDTFASRDDMIAAWESGWQRLFETLAALTPTDLARAITIRGETHTASQAILREMSHYAYHVGQIALVARVLAKDQWHELSIARGQSRQYNQRVWKRDGADTTE